MVRAGARFEHEQVLEPSFCVRETPVLAIAKGCFNHFQPASRQPCKPHQMAVRVLVGEGEQIQSALRQLRKRFEQEGFSADARRHVYFVRRTEVRRAKLFRKRFKSRERDLLTLIASGAKGATLDAAKAEFWKRTGKP